jgi:hypothetical protein
MFSVVAEASRRSINYEAQLRKIIIDFYMIVNKHLICSNKWRTTSALTEDFLWTRPMEFQRPGMCSKFRQMCFEQPCLLATRYVLSRKFLLIALKKSFCYKELPLNLTGHLVAVSCILNHPQDNGLRSFLLENDGVPLPWQIEIFFEVFYILPSDRIVV